MIEVFATVRGRFALFNTKTGKIVRRRSGQVISFQYESDAQARADRMNEA